jgi:hypothetical protein
MVAVFSTFATLSVVSMQQLGIGLAVAIFLDATLVRGRLVSGAALTYPVAARRSRHLAGRRHCDVPKHLP